MDQPPALVADAMSPRWGRGLATAGGWSVALGAIAILAFATGRGRSADVAALLGFDDVEQRAPWAGVARAAVQLADPLPFALAGMGLIVIALARRQSATALDVAVVLLGANITTQILKAALAQPRLWPGFDEVTVAAASWPSGHATASMSVALCGVLVAPARWRPFVAALAAAIAIAMGYSILTLGAHLPTDVLGGFLVAGAWAFATGSVRLRGPGPPSHVLRVALLFAAASSLMMLAAIAVAMLMRPARMAELLTTHTSFVAFASAIAVVASTLVLTLSATVDESRVDRRRGAC